MGKLVGLFVLWIAAIVLVLVIALVPEVDESAYQGAGSAAMLTVLLILLVLGLGPRWGSLFVAAFAGAAFNDGAWVIATLLTVLLLVLLVIASRQLIDAIYEETPKPWRGTTEARATQPMSLEELQAVRADVQTMIDQGPAGGGTVDLEELRDRIDQQIREQER